MEAQSVSVGGPGAQVLVNGATLEGVGVHDPELNGKVRAVIRQEHLELGQPGATNTFPARHVNSVFLGAVWEHWVEVGADRLRFHSPHKLTGEQLTMHVPREKLLVFH
jgi:hypothetical protein